MSKKTKKQVAFWKAYEGTIIDKGAKKQIKRINRRYTKHRAKNKCA